MDLLAREIAIIASSVSVARRIAGKTGKQGGGAKHSQFDLLTHPNKQNPASRAKSRALPSCSVSSLVSHYRSHTVCDSREIKSVSRHTHTPNRFTQTLLQHPEPDTKLTSGSARLQVFKKLRCSQESQVSADYATILAMLTISQFLAFFLLIPSFFANAIPEPGLWKRVIANSSQVANSHLQENTECPIAFRRVWVNPGKYYRDQFHRRPD